MWCFMSFTILFKIKIREKVQGVPQSQAAALPRHQEEEETDKTKQAQIEQTYKKLISQVQIELTYKKH